MTKQKPKRKCQCAQIYQAAVRELSVFPGAVIHSVECSYCLARKRVAAR